MVGYAIVGDVVVQTTGEVTDRARDYVRTQVEAFLRRLAWPLQSVRVRLTVFGRSSGAWPTLTQVNLDLRGQQVRVRVPAAFLREAGGLLRSRLAAQMSRLADPDESRPWPQQPPTGPQPRAHTARGAEIVRRKLYPLSRCTPDQAALTMDLMDYDCHLFVDAETGQDSLIYRVGPTGYRLARLSAMAPPTQPVKTPMTINCHPVPRLTTAEAVERLNATGLPYRFFQEDTSGRGAVLYRRYDGHYGLVTPQVGDPAEQETR